MSKNAKNEGKQEKKVELYHADYPSNGNLIFLYQ